MEGLVKTLGILLFVLGVALWQRTSVRNGNLRG